MSGITFCHTVGNPSSILINTIYTGCPNKQWIAFSSKLCSSFLCDCQFYHKLIQSFFYRFSIYCEIDSHQKIVPKMLKKTNTLFTFFKGQPVLFKLNFPDMSRQVSDRGRRVPGPILKHGLRFSSIVVPVRLTSWFVWQICLHHLNHIIYKDFGWEGVGHAWQEKKKK